MAVSRTEGGLGLMSCVRESSPPDLPDAEDVHHEPKKRRFHPLRGLRRMFRRKERSRAPQTVTVSADELNTPEAESRERAGTTTTDDARRRSGSGLHSGLSLSHDSVFSPEQRSAPESGSELETSSSLSMQRLVHANTGVQAELVDAVRRRRTRDDTSDDEDLGLPRSPASSSPTAADVLEKVLKENVNKSNHSTCSDGSLLSMGSSEMDEDSYGQSSGHGSKLSLHDKKPETTEVEVTSEPLSHSAARHKMSVKPKRTHGVPRKRRSTPLGEVTMLPATPEVNEESNSISVGRSITPDLPVATGNVSATQLKSASLPPGTAPTWDQSPVKLSRSRSSATNKQLDSTTEQDEPESLKKEDTSFFGRLLSRRSGKKKKTVEEPSIEIPQKRMDEKGRYVHEVTKLGRHHPGARQRVEPINISQDCSISRMQVFYPPSPPPPDSPPRRHKETEILDDECTLEGRLPLRKIIPLEVDSSIPKRTFVKKSQSFRRDEALPFVSLDTPSLPVGLRTDVQKDEVEDLNELTTLEVVDHHLISERTEEAVKDVTTTVTINSSEEVDCCEVTVTREDVKEYITETQVIKTVSLDNIHISETESIKECDSTESVTHQITIPVGSSIVNITQTINEPRHSVLPHGVKPEPRKSLKEGNKEVPNFYPIPAPRPSKRESLEAKPPRVPEFLRVQLNHVDNKPSVNVVLSTTSGSNIEDKSPEIQEVLEKDLVLKEDPVGNKLNPSRKNSKSDEVDDKEKFEREDPQGNIVKPELCVAKELVDPNQIKFLNSVKQWSASPYAISNPNYSIVSIAPRNVEINKAVDKPVAVTNQSVQKTVIIKEVKEKSSILVDKSQDVPSPMKVVLRQRSFVSDEKPTNIVTIDKPSKIEDIKFAPRKKSLTKEFCTPDIERSRKLSLERFDMRNQENMSDFSKRKSREMSSSEDNIVDRNSYSSSDTLASQDSGEVVLRRKSLSREIVKQKEEEPELLKVFARRSLKVKDMDTPDDIEALNYPPMKSRDSDKENECGDSPPEERKKIKEHLTESKVSEKTVPNSAYKYQRSVSANNEETHTAAILATSKKDNNYYEKRQRSRTIPDSKIIDPPSPISHKVLASIFQEKEVEVISLEPDENSIEKEESVPRFKRIQQRKEEWEKRAQLAMKKTHP